MEGGTQGMMEGPTYKGKKQRTDRWIYGYMDEWMDEMMAGHMDRWINGWMDG